MRVEDAARRSVPFERCRSRRKGGEIAVYNISYSQCNSSSCRLVASQTQSFRESDSHYSSPNPSSPAPSSRSLHAQSHLIYLPLSPAQTTITQPTRGIAILDHSAFLLAPRPRSHRPSSPHLASLDPIRSLSVDSLPFSAPPRSHPLAVLRTSSFVLLRPTLTSGPSQKSLPPASAPPSAPQPIPSPSLESRRRSPISAPPAPPVSLDLRAA